MDISTTAQTFAVVGTFNGSSPALSGSRVVLLSAQADHAALSLEYKAPVNVQAFTTNFTFIPEGINIALIFNNSNNNPYFNGDVFSAGAGCEADFFQGYSQPNPPNNVFAMELDSANPLVNGNAFTYSSAQIYKSNPYVSCPCQPSVQGCGSNNSDSALTKLSTSPVPLNSPVSTAFTTTGDTYSANVTYDGSNFTLNLYDVTAGGSCPGATCYSHTWTGVNIPASVNGNTAWVGLGGATGSGGGFIPSTPLYINSFVYTEGSPSPTPTPKPTPTVTATHTPTPTATPTPISKSCVSIVSPAKYSWVSGSAVPIQTIDHCPGVSFETLKLGWKEQPLGTFPIGQVIFKSTSVAKGWRKLTVTSQSKNPGSVQLGSASVIVGVWHPAATPTP